jgi:hypothetical protein
MAFPGSAGGVAVISFPGTGVSRYLTAHEFGHVFDAYVLLWAGFRDRWARSVEGHSWHSWADGYRNARADEERFADAYGLVATRRHFSRRLRGSYGETFSAGQLRKTRRLVKKAWRRWRAQPLISHWGQPDGAL